MMTKTRLFNANKPIMAFSGGCQKNGSAKNIITVPLTPNNSNGAWGSAESDRRRVSTLLEGKCNSNLENVCDALGEALSVRPEHH